MFQPIQNMAKLSQTIICWVQEPMWFVTVGECEAAAHCIPVAWPESLGCELGRGALPIPLGGTFLAGDNKLILGCAFCPRRYRLKGASPSIRCLLQGDKAAWSPLPACQGKGSCPVLDWKYQIFQPRNAQFLVYFTKGSQVSIPARGELLSQSRDSPGASLVPAACESLTETASPQAAEKSIPGVTS